MLEISSRTYRRWIAELRESGRTVDARPQAAKEREYKHAITPEIRQLIIDTCLSDEFVMLPPAQIVPILADKGYAYD